jgi:putative addiction module component (TIGR02574 family)
MDSSPNIFDLGIDQWSVDDRLRLIGQIWDSLPEPMGEIPEWHREILDERIAQADANPDSFIPWEEVRARLSQRP